MWLFLLNFLAISKFSMKFIFLLLMRLIFPWINFRGFSGFLANPPKFVFFFYLPKSTLPKFLSELLRNTGGIIFWKRILLFNNLNQEIYWLIWYIFSNFVIKCSFYSIKIMGIRITYLVTAKISPNKIIKI